MSLLSIEEISSDVRLGLWKMDEKSEDDFLCIEGMADIIPDIVSKYRSESRRREKLSVYALLFTMTGDASLLIHHEESGKPFVDGWKISVSHTKGYATLILSRNTNVAVDIEYMSDRVERIVKRFIRPDEPMNGQRQHLINWSAKETMYKYFSEEDLQYFDMRVHAFEDNEEGTLVIDDLKKTKTLEVRYKVTKEYVITYSAF